MEKLYKLLILLICSSSVWGQLYVASDTLHVASGAILFVNSNLEMEKTTALSPVLSLEGSIEITGNVELDSTLVTGPGWIGLNGSSLQELDLKASPLPKLVLNNAGNALLKSPSQVSDSLLFMAGLLDIADNDLWVGNTGVDSGAIAGAGASSYIQTSGTGTLQRHISGPTLFPVGSANYNPARLSLGTAGNLGVRAENGLNQQYFPSANPQTANAVNKAWYIQHDYSNTLDVSLYWQAIDELAGFTRDSSAVSFFDTASQQWVDPTTAQGAQNYNGLFGQSKSGLSQFNTYFAVLNGNPCIPSSTLFNDSICLGDSLYVGGDWQNSPGVYVDTAYTSLGCDSLLITNLFLRPDSTCMLDTAEKVLYLVSDSGWTLSTVVTQITSNSYPWPGVATLVPHDSTFTLPVEVGQPYPWTHLYTVQGSEVIKAYSGVTYYRYEFKLSEYEDLNARFRMFVDDNMQIFINRNEIALEEDMGKVNWRTANHDILFHDNELIENGYNSGDPFDSYTSQDLDNVFQTGWNDVILAIRNRTSKPDKGGFSFRMDLDKAGQAVIIKKDKNLNPTPHNLGFVLYPNPTVDVSSVVFTEAPNASVTVTITDVSGKLLQAKSYNLDSIENGLSLDVGHYADGIYFVKIQIGNKTYVERLIKQ